MVTKNLQPSDRTGVVNGSRGVLHSLSWVSGYQVPAGCKPGQIVKVPVPSQVNVLLDYKSHKKFMECDTTRTQKTHDDDNNTTDADPRKSSSTSAIAIDMPGEASV